MDSEAERSSLTLKPSDILGSLATLIGLLFTAIGLLANAKLDPGVFKVLASVLVIILLLFMTTATLAATVTVTRRTVFWNIAKGIYSISWLAFCVGVVAMLLVIIYGPNVFTVN